MSRAEEPLAPALGHAAPYALYDLAPPAGSWPVPAAFAEAARLDELARDAYAADDYLAASDLFMAVAAALRGEADQPYAETLAADRMLTYENAAAAWAMADRLDEARAALREAAAADAACADSIRLLLENLPYPAPRDHQLPATGAGG
jgi:hypothetical protein